MKKKLFTLLVCALAWGHANADKWTVEFSTDDEGKSVATLTCTSAGEGINNFPDSYNSFTDVDGSSLSANEGKTKLQNASTLIFKTNPNVEIASIDAITGLTCQATTVDFSGATFAESSAGTKQYKDNRGEWKTVETYSNCMKFSEFKNCSTAVLANVKTLCHGTFAANSKMETTFTIPGTVTYIASQMCYDTPISSIVIPESVKYIDSQAFQNASIESLLDVYVKSTETAACGGSDGAFDGMITVGQTQGDRYQYATLHFPPGAEALFTNQAHGLTLETSMDKDKFHEWLGAHKTLAGDNGWKQFINAAPGNTPPGPDAENVITLRTFSDTYAHYVPLNYRAYLVNDIVREGEGFKVVLQETYAIPANTGVIIYGESGPGGLALPILSGSDNQHWYSNPYTRDTDTEVGGKSLRNYLVANCSLAAGTQVGPYDVNDEGTEVTDRNFVLCNFYSTSLKDQSKDDYVAFFRMKKMTPGANKAHLHVPAGKFNNPKGAECVVINPQDFRASLWNRSFTDWGEWGLKSTGVLAKSFGEPFEDIITGINNVSIANDGTYYTLQGMKTTNPDKGVYIKNGKKVVIK